MDHQIDRESVSRVYWRFLKYLSKAFFGLCLFHWAPKLHCFSLKPCGIGHIEPRNISITYLCQIIRQNIEKLEHENREKSQEPYF